MNTKPKGSSLYSVQLLFQLVTQKILTGFWRKWVCHVLPLWINKNRRHLFWWRLLSEQDTNSRAVPWKDCLMFPYFNMLVDTFWVKVHLIVCWISIIEDCQSSNGCHAMSDMWGLTLKYLLMFKSFKCHEISQCFCLSVRLFWLWKTLGSILNVKYLLDSLWYWWNPF